MPTLEIPNQPRTKRIKLKASTGKRDEPGFAEEEFEIDCPADLASAIALEGDKGVMRRWVSGWAIEKQGEKRMALKPAVEGKTRVKAGYLETLGL